MHRETLRQYCEEVLYVEVTMQNLLSDFRIFFDTEYFSCAFRLIFVHGLLHLVSLALAHFDCYFISTEKLFLTHRFDI